MQSSIRIGTPDGNRLQAATTRFDPKSPQKKDAAASPTNHAGED